MINILNIGDKAPEFRLQNQNEEYAELHNFKDKWLVLYFYPKDNTSG
jgi:thioredoxin-dependent peroxiredoxin